MASVRSLKKDVFYVGSIDWDRKVFDALIPLPDGTSYNSYLIKASDKTVLIDTVDPEFTAELLNKLNELSVSKIDYVVCNHAEQDHSGSIPVVLEKYPEAKVITNQKCKGLLIDHLGLVEDDFIVIEDRQVLSLGDKTLQFFFAPFVHWPETMFTHLIEDKILFSCDFLGAHYASSELFAHDQQALYDPLKRYYAEIMMPFRVNVRKHLALLKELDFDMVAPSHGQVYDNPQFVIDHYSQWASDKTKKEVLIAFVSMHDSTRQMARALGDSLMRKGIEVKEVDIANADIGKLAMELVDAAGLAIGSPTVLAGAHPQAAYAVYLANALRPKTKVLGIFGSYGWGGKMVDQLAGLLTAYKPEILDPVVIKGAPNQQDLELIESMAQQFAERLNA